MTTQIELVEVQRTTDDVGAKLVFRSKNGQGRWATFETGSFLAPTVDGIPEKHDICISTAGGCTRHCTFCAASSPDPGFERLLTAEEIVAQADEAVRLRNNEGRYPNVIGLMGNGEPPDNPQLIPALHALMDRPYPVERILVSTIGENIRAIESLTKAFAGKHKSRVPVILHVSLHAVAEHKRRTLIPGRRSLNDIMKVVDAFGDAAYDPVRNPYPVRINVVLMERDSPPFSNATENDARLLGDLMEEPSHSSAGTARRVLKLSAFNPILGIPYRQPSEQTRQHFVATLANRDLDLYSFTGSGITIDERAATGGFACGQLRATTAALLERGGGGGVQAGGPARPDGKP